MKKSVITVKKVLKTIKQCQTQEQIDDCRIMVQKFLKSVEKDGIMNLDDLKMRLEEQLLERWEELMLAKMIFNDKE